MKTVIELPPQFTLPGAYRVEFHSDTMSFHWANPFETSEPVCSVWIARRLAWEHSNKRVSADAHL